MINLPEEERERVIGAQWQQSIQEKGKAAKYLADVVIYAHNRNALLADVAHALTEKDIEILSMNSRISRKGIATMQTSFEIANQEELSRIISKLMTIDGVIDVTRNTN